MSRSLKVRPDGWKCDKCRYFQTTKHAAYDGVCLMQIRAAHNEGERGLTANYRATQKGDWCMEYEEKKQAKAGAGQIGLLEPGEPVVSKTGGDR